MGVIDTVGVIGGFGLIAGADGFNTFRILIPAGSALAGSGVGGAGRSPVGGNVGSNWSEWGTCTEFVS